MFECWLPNYTHTHTSTQVTNATNETTMLDSVPMALNHPCFYIVSCAGLAETAVCDISQSLS